VRCLTILQQVDPILSSFPRKVGFLQNVLVWRIVQQIHNEVLEEQLLLFLLVVPLTLVADLEVLC
jgi:hypothetical protein